GGKGGGGRGEGVVAGSEEEGKSLGSRQGWPEDSPLPEQAMDELPRQAASVQRPGGDPGRPRTRDRRPLPRDPPPQLPRPAAGPVRLGPDLPQRDRRPGLAPAAPAARRTAERRGGPA